MNSEKSSDFYLSQINQNIDEKISDLISLIMLNKLPKNDDGIIKILEFGMGGCDQFLIINRYAPCNSIVVGADILDLKNNIQDYGAIFKKMDITNITEKNNTVSIINASAIFHEVFSYGDFLGTIGYNALKTAFPASINLLQKMVI